MRRSPALRQQDGDGGDEPRDPRSHQSPREPRRAPVPFPKLLVGVHVLIIDDDEDARELFRTALSACGARVTLAPTARAGLAEFLATRPRVVVSDVAMPEEDGYWLVGQIRGCGIADLAPTPVLAVTAFGRQHSRERTTAAGFSEHMTKPVDPAALCLAVARLAGRSG